MTTTPDGLTIIDPLGVDSISVTAQERESCSDHGGSWIQHAQEFGFDEDDDDYER